MLFKITENTYNQLNENYMGICHACGSISETCEPDAENYTCDFCNEDQVFGTAQTLIMGKLELCDNKSQENIRW